MILNQDLCYLCGKPGTDDRDHVAPKAFLGTGNYKGASRIVLPTHDSCNRGFSKDEEYVRDLVAPSTKQSRLPGTQQIREKADRALQRPAGLKRRREFLKSATRVNLRTPGGIYIENALGIRSDRNRVNNVGKKITRGIIYYDTGAIIYPREVECVYIPIQDVIKEKDKELKKRNHIGLTFV